MGKEGEKERKGFLCILSNWELILVEILRQKDREKKERGERKRGKWERVRLLA